MVSFTTGMMMLPSPLGMPMSSHISGGYSCPNSMQNTNLGIPGIPRLHASHSAVMASQHMVAFTTGMLMLPSPPGMPMSSHISGGYSCPNSAQNTNLGIPGIPRLHASHSAVMASQHMVSFTTGMLMLPSPPGMP